MPSRAAYPCPRCRHLTWRRDRKGNAKCGTCGHTNDHARSAAERGYDATWRAARRAALERDGYRCQIRAQGCTRYADTVDHIIPLARGGSHHHSNLQAACHHCNSSKQARLF